MGDYWIHDLDPTLIHIYGPLAIRWYGLAYLAGIVCGWWLVRRWARRGLIPMSDEAAGDMVLYIGLGMIIGGRLGYCIFYDPGLWLEFGNGFPWWGVLKVYEGGMASHGGIVGFFTGGWLFARKHRIPMLVLGDGVATVIAFGIIFGRLANFINGELFGRETDVAWGVKFALSIPGGIPQHIAQWSPEWYAYVDSHAVPRHPSQLYAVVIEGLIPLLVSLYVLGRHRRPGLNIGIILGLYSIGRIAGEFFREPDAQFRNPGEEHGFVISLFSMGQLLTLPVLAAGLWFFIHALRKGPQPHQYLSVEERDQLAAVGAGESSEPAATTPSTGKP